MYFYDILLHINELMLTVFHVQVCLSHVLLMLTCMFMNVVKMLFNVTYSYSVLANVVNVTHKSIIHGLIF